MKIECEISVCMTTYNGEKFVKEQIDSVLPQLKESDELIISDDGSIDATVDIIKSYNDCRIKLYTNEFHDLTKNFEFVLSKAQGEFIFLSDQDDVWIENKVSIMINNLQEYDVAVSDCIVVDGGLNTIFSSFYNGKKLKRGFWNNLIRNNYLGCCIAFRRNVLNCILPFPSKIAMHDDWIGLCAEAFLNPVFINEKLILYRRHGKNFSNTGGKSEFSYVYRIKYRLYFLIQILRLFLKRKVYDI